GERGLPRRLGRRRSGHEHGLDQDGAREARRPVCRGGRDRRRALRVPDRTDGVQPERVERAREVVAELLPAISGGRLAALAVPTLVDGEDMETVREPTRIRVPQPGVEPGRVQEDERRAIAAEVEIVEAEVAGLDEAAPWRSHRASE